ncbi:hypothetical protein [Virgisporangium ochraceum]|uniref:Amidase n=1 Tax=Virgisporangium ochraceum TaxID=65505 RepID=A0A8J4E9D9_9ACTN|nr:hypothetical protein [Virgisporangium ochraceum]GIJ66641.1 hypothetical protein Voc01_015580 [Virgisporangium ochraceum]
MKRLQPVLTVVLLFGLLAGLLVAAAPYRFPPFAPESPVAPPGTRAAWVWSWAEPERMVAWSRTQGVRTLFVHVDRDARTNGDAARLLRLRALCDEAGIRLDALGGEPGWALDHTYAFAWRDTVVDLGLFRGLHLDVEPYLLPEWPSPRAVTGFLDLLDALRGGNLPLEADVPFWYHTVPVGTGTLADEVIARVDALTVMSYRDTATGILDVASDVLDRAGAAAVPVRLAVETQPLADCAYCSFSQRTVMEAALREVDAAGQRFAAFEGVAVHRYDTWTALPE